MRHYLDFMLRSWPLLGFGFASVFWGNFGQSFFISWYGAAIQDSLGLSAGRYGSLYSLATLGSGLLILVFGGMIDRWPLRRFALCSAAGLVAACLVLANAIHELLLLLGFFLIRLFGQGLLPHTASITMARYFDAHRGKALSLSSSAMPVGEVVLPLLAVSLIQQIGWRQSWWVLALSVLLVYMPLLLWLLHRTPVDTTRPPATAEPHSLARSAGRADVLRDRRFWLALPALLAGPFVVTAVFIHQGFIVGAKGWTPAWLATCFVAYGVVHWLSALAAGVIIDRLNARFLLRLMLLPLAASLAALVLLEGDWVAALFLVLLGMSIGAANPVGGALWAEVYGTARLGSIRALMSSLMILATAVSPVLFGLLIDGGVSLRALFGGAAWGTVAAIALVQFSWPPARAVRHGRE